MADQTLHIRDPWTMPYFEYEQEFIDQLHREIRPDHPLYRKRLYVVAVRQNPTAVIFQTVSKKPIYPVVYFTGRKSTRKGLPKTKLLASLEEVGKFMDKDHDKWIEWCKRHGCYDTLKPLCKKSPED